MFLIKTISFRAYKASFKIQSLQQSWNWSWPVLLWCDQTNVLREKDNDGCFVNGSNQQGHDRLVTIVYQACAVLWLFHMDFSGIGQGWGSKADWHLCLRCVWLVWIQKFNTCDVLVWHHSRHRRKLILTIALFKDKVR